MTTLTLESDDLRRTLLELLTYLATSARGVVDEPRLYGPLRLMEAASRIIHLMDRLGLSDDDLNTLASQILAGAMILSTNDEWCKTFTDSASTTFASKLRDA